MANARQEEQPLWPEDDLEFDKLYPDWARKLSRMHWTPIQVARRGAALLARRPDLNRPARILDIGSGVGKFCLVGALTTEAEFVGVEQRPHFVEIARRIIETYRIPRVDYVMGDVFEMDWESFDGIYLYNPFQENRAKYDAIDRSVILHPAIYDRSVRLTCERLERMPAGTGLVTYHGFGGRPPDSYKPILNEYCYRGPLEYLVKRK